VRLNAGMTALLQQNMNEPATLGASVAELRSVINA